MRLSCWKFKFGLFGRHIVTVPVRTLTKPLITWNLASIASMASSASPDQPEVVTIDGRQYRSVREGRASVLAPYSADASNPTPARKGHNNDEGSQAVFYNPIQQFNRDLSVLAILVHGEGAVAQKSILRARKEHKGSATRQQKGRPSTLKEGEILNGESTNASSTTKKRKADDLDEDVVDSGRKRSRNAELDVEDEEIEVLQLNGDSASIEKPSEGQNLNIETENADVSEAPQPRKIRYSILDALSATGLRALRYAKEIPFATHIVANDFSHDAVKSIELNIDHNDVGKVVRSNVDDARAYMYGKVGNERSTSDSYIHRFDVVDLDPYGTAAPFLDAAIQCLQDGGMLCVTCTDAGVFASNGYPEKAYSLYGGVPCKGPWSHEAGLRLILHAVSTSAAKYGIAVEPLLSLSIDFYARVFVRLHKSANEVKMLAGTTMTVHNCDAGCGAWTTHPVSRNQEATDKKGGTYYKHTFAQAPPNSVYCDQCSAKMHVGGPMWAGPIHNPYFVQKMLDRLESLDTSIYETSERLKGMLTLALEEDLTMSTNNTEANTSVSRSDASQTDHNIIPRLPPATIDSAPFFFQPGALSKVLHCKTPGEDPLRGAIRSLGYLVTRSHCKPGSFKTTAPWSVIWDVMREWVRKEAPIKEGVLSERSPGYKIMQRASGTRSQYVQNIVDNVKSKLQQQTDEPSLKDLLRSAMYQLEREGVAPTNGRQDQASRIQFDAKLGQERPRGRLVRYQVNPRANWGPMNRANGG
jgi:tRNA (guanine26-N2/guanine27-N2)-dimethyltransferase